MTSSFDIEKIDWTKGDGLVPAIVQDFRSLQVLMLGYMNREALSRTLETGLVTFYSRSKGRLWQKGEESGHVLRLKTIKADCDQDAFLISASPEGPTCHLGTQSCFGDASEPSLAVLAKLQDVIRERRQNPDEASYTSRLFKEGINRIAQKVGEEGVEVALAAATGRSLTEEAADLLYHLGVLLEATDHDWLNVMDVLHERAKAPRPSRRLGAPTT